MRGTRVRLGLGLRLGLELGLGEPSWPRIEGVAPLIEYKSSTRPLEYGDCKGHDFQRFFKSFPFLRVAPESSSIFEPSLNERVVRGREVCVTRCVSAVLDAR